MYLLTKTKSLDSQESSETAASLVRWSLDAKRSEMAFSAAAQKLPAAVAEAVGASPCRRCTARSCSRERCRRSPCAAETSEAGKLLKGVLKAMPVAEKASESGPIGSHTIYIYLMLFNII